MRWQPSRRRGWTSGGTLLDQDDFVKQITVEIIVDNIWHAEQAPAPADKLFEIIKANASRIRSPSYDA
jgi:hypothetical protein